MRITINSCEYAYLIVMISFLIFANLIIQKLISESITSMHQECNFIATTPSIHVPHSTSAPSYNSRGDNYDRLVEKISLKGVELGKA